MIMGTGTLRNLTFGLRTSIAYRTVGGRSLFLPATKGIRGGITAWTSFVTCGL
jgi:hypothetical protein